VAEDAIPITDQSFKCLNQMTKVKHFYVDNLLGDLDATVAVAKSETGGVYPPGSVLQLFAGEVMVKQRPGFNPATKDWEFFELDVSPEGSKIAKRGFVDVNNRFGGNCFGCHAAARPEFDLVCEQDHGCAPIPVTRAMFGALQKSDPRCQPAAELTEDDKKSLAELGEIIKAIMEQNQAK
jgi:hypothetical protein